MRHPILEDIPRFVEDMEYLEAYIKRLIGRKYFVFNAVKVY